MLEILAAYRAKLGIELHVVHVNHMIRGAEADADQAYVEKICSELGVDCKGYKVDVTGKAEKENITVEEAGREVRYNLFNQTCGKYGYGESAIAVAHNKNDVAETVVFNMLRGSGISGMKGIVPKRDNIVRPLLESSRDEIEAYLKRKNISFCTDSTNTHDDYTRNKIRHNILPLMEEINPKAVEHIFQMAGKAADYHRLADKLADEFIERNVECKSLLKRQGAGSENRSEISSEASCEIGSGISDTTGGENRSEVSGEASCEIDSGISDTTGGETHSETCGKSYSLDIKELQTQDSLVSDIIILKLIGKACGGLKDIGQNHVGEVKKLLKADTGASIRLPKNQLAIIQYGKLVFKDYNEDCKTEKIAPIDIELEKDQEEIVEKTVENELGRLRVRVYKRPKNLDLSKKECTKFVDYGKIKGNLQFRNWKKDDYIVINSAGSRKKINRLYTDCKVPAGDRVGVPLVVEGSQVVWAVGLRIGENYKVDKDTTWIAELDYCSL
jgi:tRNA(Ile)-lysidine synthase